MLRLLHRSPFRLSIALHQSFTADLRLLHDAVPKTLIPSVSDAAISYLVGSCGLSPAEALKVTEKITLKTTGRSNSFFSLLRSHGFTQNQITHIVTSCPQLLNYNQEKKIKPKMEFFLNLGYTSTELAKLISAYPQILCYSLEKKLSPNFHLLRSALGSDREVAIAIGNSSQILIVPDNVLLSNIKTLREMGVPQHNILKIVAQCPRALTNNPSRFNKAVAWLKKIGFDVSKPEFIRGVNARYMLSPSTWGKKFELYRSLGWSEESILTAVRKYPSCMVFSEGKIKQQISFFLEKLKCDPSYVSARPFLLYYSFEKRIAPRYKIFCLLAAKGLTKKNMDFITFLYMTEKEFIDKYVNKYACQIPEVLEVYKDR